MKCYKCGYEFDNGNSCPKCGANAIVVNEDYLRRKKEYEESGKVSISQLSFKQSENGDEDVVAEEESYEPVDFLKNVYDKMKNKSHASKPKKVIMLKKHSSKKVKKAKQEKKNKDFFTGKVAKFLPYVAFTAVVLLILLLFIVINNMDKDYIYAVSRQKTKSISGTRILVMNKGLYINTNGKISRITDKEVTALNSNDTFSGILYETDEGIFYHYGKKSTRIYDGTMEEIVSSYISPTGKNAAFAVYEDNTYIIYQVYAGKLQTISRGAESKEIFMVLDNGAILYKEIEYSGINGVNSMNLTYYNGGVRRTLSEDFIDGVYVENGNKLLILNSQGELYMYSGKDFSSTSLFLNGVEMIYTQSSKNIYTTYGDRYTDIKDNIILIAQKTVAINCEDMSSKKLSDNIIFEKIIYYGKNFYGVKDGKIYDRNNKALSEIGQCLPAFDARKNGVLFWDNGKIKLLSNNKIKTVCSVKEEPKTINATKKYISYVSSDETIHILKRNGKEKEKIKDAYIVTQ